MTLRGPEARGATIAELDPRCLPLWVLPSLSIAEVYLTFESITVSCMHQFDRCEDRLFTLTPPPSASTPVSRYAPSIPRGPFGPVTRHYYVTTGSRGPLRGSLRSVRGHLLGLSELEIST